MRWWTGLVVLVAGVALAVEQPTGEGLGRVVRTEGTVRVLPAEGFRKEPAEPGRTLAKGDMVLTADGAKAVLAFRDGSRVALDAGTKLEVRDAEGLHQEGGQALYRIRDRGSRGRRVRTEFSVIGVKGTEFLVSDTEEARAVAMADGEVAVEAPEGRFKLYREKEKAGFASYRERQRQGMEDYKEEFQEYKKRVRREFVDYVRSFSLESGRMAAFGDGEATTGAVSAELERDIQRLRDLL